MSTPTRVSKPEDTQRPVRIAVIGAGGFVGSRLVAMGRLEAAYSIVPVLRSFRGLARLGADGEGAIVTDTQNSTALAAAIAGCDAVVNASSGDSLRIKADTKTILTACRKAGVARLIHLGSTIVFGRVSEATIDDDSAPNTHSWNLYARNKARTDVWLRSRMGADALQIVVLRPGLIWGPGSVWASIVGDQLWRGNAVLANNGQGIANLIYVDNLVRMILSVAGKPHGGSGLYNVADLETVTWGEWYKTLAERLGYASTDIQLSPRRRVHLSSAAAIEWCSNRSFLLKSAKRMPKAMAEAVKRILRGGAQSHPGPFRQLIGDPQSPLRLTRSMMDIQNTAHRLPMDKFLRDFGPIDMVPFEKAAATTAIWLRYAGFTMPDIGDRRHESRRDTPARPLAELRGGGGEQASRAQKADSGPSEKRNAVGTDPVPSDMPDMQSAKPDAVVNEKAVRTIVGGCGAITERVYQTCLCQLEQRGYINVVGFVEANSARLELARHWFPRAQAFENVSSCYEQLADVELTLVTTPPPLHGEHALAAFANGSHVLTEKPLASSVKSGREMVDAASRCRKVLAVGMPRRFYPALLEARRRLVAGELGDSVHFDCREGGVYSWQVATPAPFQRETSGGGVLLDKGAHTVDGLVFLFGPGKVLAAADDGTARGVEANVVIDLALERGAGRLQMSYDMPLNGGLHVVGTGGELWWPIDALDCLYARRDASSAWQTVSMGHDWPMDMQRSGGRRGVPADYHECFTFQLVQMLRAIRYSEPPAVSGAEALIPLGLIESGYAQASLLDKPWLPEVERGVAASRHWRSYE